MKTTVTNLGLLSLVIWLTLIASPAGAKVPAPSSLATGSPTTIVPLLKAPRLLLADNVVVSPGTAAPEPAQPAQTVVVPQATQPVAAPAPIIEQPARRKEVRADVSGPRNYMSTVALSALMGGLAGGLIGGAFHYVGNNQDWRDVAYWAAGGVLVGAGVGVVQVVVQENRVAEATALNHLPTDPAPTYRVALLRTQF